MSWNIIIKINHTEYCEIAYIDRKLDRCSKENEIYTK